MPNETRESSVVMAKQEDRAQLRELSGKLELQIKEFEQIVKSEKEHIKETSLQKFLQLVNTFTIACKKFTCFYKGWKETRQENIKNLTSMANDLEETTHKANISRVAGSTAGVAGAVLTIAGLITMPLSRKSNN